MTINVAPVHPPGCVFHHVGYASRCIKSDSLFFSNFGYSQEGHAFTDPVQGVTGVFLSGNGPRLEILQDLPGRGTLKPWLQAGVRFYHFAYLTTDLRACLSWSRAERGKVIITPVPSVAFDGRMISFVMFRNGLLIELIEAERFSAGV